MAQNSGQSGPVTELAHQAAERVNGVAGWLEERQPGDILTEVKDYARRNPGTFLVGAAVLGVLAGRLTRELSAASDGAGGGPTPAYDPERTAVIPTPPAQRAVPDQIPPGGYLDPTPRPATPARARPTPTRAPPPATPTRRTAPERRCPR
ncbi:hypothetical protein GA0070558_10227 [Micromonospora haikouensis]|uniref:Uncharacterized protein n=1 Tax=Micromonospora haikouensis TaxID=686309 RepID=A0A1C4U214_9ACTN|nr:hypothetical protein [Micromonospora haikouensis]SCE65706.1 hypothetical protein GA0070558_10227 [Micromonospora haikouensis]